MELTPGRAVSPDVGSTGGPPPPAMPTPTMTGFMLSDRDVWFRLMEQNPLVLRHLLNVATQSLRGEATRLLPFGEMSEFPSLLPLLLPPTPQAFDVDIKVKGVNFKNLFFLLQDFYKLIAIKYYFSPLFFY